MKKQLALLLTTVLVASSMAACGGSAAAESTAAGAAETAGSAAEEAAETAESAAEDAAAAAESTAAETVESAADAAESSVESTAAAAESTAESTAAAAESAAAPAGGEEEIDDTETELQVFIAASLNTVMQDVAAEFNKTHPNVTITYNADSSGTLLTQIQEGYACDVFFSAAQKQMNTLEEDGMLVDGTRRNVVNNQVVVVTRKDSGTSVTGLSDIGNASSIALADGSVPVGKYTRQALVNLGTLPETEDASAYTTAEVSEALGGVEISEQGNVSKVLAAVVEASCEVGTTYYSDTYGYEDQLDILEYVPYDLTGDVIYPIAQVKNEEATEDEAKEAAAFVEFVGSDACKAIFDAYYFDTNVEN